MVKVQPSEIKKWVEGKERGPLLGVKHRVTLGGPAQARKIGEFGVKKGSQVWDNDFVL